MKNIIIPFLLFLLFPLFSFAQIEVEISKSPDNIYYLRQYRGDKLLKIDSAKIIKGKLKYSIKKNIIPGMYSISSGENAFVFFIDEPHIVFKTQWPAMQDSLKIIKSKYNNIYFSYISDRNSANKKLELLSPLLSFYPQNTDFYKSAYKEFDQVQKKLHFWTDSIIEKYPRAIVSKMIEIDMKPYVSPDFNIYQQKEYLKDHWFDNVDFNDTAIIYSNIFTNKIADYLSLYGNPNFTKEQLIKSFSNAIDNVLQLSLDNDKMYEFTINYFLRGFEKYHFEELLLHIANNYQIPGQCENDEASSDFENKIEKYKNMAEGKVVPDINLPNIDGQIISLSKIKTPYKLLIFWSSKCSHCMRLMPKINKWYKNLDDKTLTIFTVSLDDNKESLEQALSDLEIPWTVVTDFKGWNNAAANDFNIYATPTMFILDKENKILAKPITYNELKRAIKKIGVK